jgi:hypothetical protein
VADTTPIEVESPHPLSSGKWTIVSPTQLGGLRAQLRNLASRWALPEDCTDRLLTVANELVANAIDHARTCGVSEVVPGSLTSGNRRSDMIPACHCGCCT